MTRVAICAPSKPISRELAAALCALVQEHTPAITLSIHDQCFADEGHFAGPDALRLAAFLECANDPAIDAVWFARGGYGAVRIAADALAGLNAAAREKIYLGYSDAGTMLGAFSAARIGQSVHAPMPADLLRDGGDAAVLRTLGWLAGDTGGLEPSLDDTPAAAFNLMTLAMLVGTPLMPDLRGYVVMIEEVSEYLYAVDRLLFHVTAHLGPMGIAGLRLGRVSDVPENDRPFGAKPEDMARLWCARSGIRFLGSADIGHDCMNKIVPFGLARRRWQE